MEGFKKFLLQGNLVQLAVAVVIGTVFSNLITAFTEGFITPLLGIFGGVPEFGDASFTVNGSVFNYGQFIDAVISFLITAAILYFFVVLPVAKLLERTAKVEEATTRECPYCYSEIDKRAGRCSNCTSEVIPETPPEETLEEGSPSS
ncbi:large conductance mechanosensitive channel protein MscL [Nocardiopsis xinjiangensis]|uniref:large conductance mechanosensitive channel protein MscL n=1 Tax=Nocardiopsis xinjiangensis TaxID=124285 RepID=UPI000346621A|nr:large conductance mechanosensitive channel protein MscL [Nocardiopsis xinjiangensis]